MQIEKNIDKLPIQKTHEVKAWRRMLILMFIVVVYLCEIRFLVQYKGFKLLLIEKTQTFQGKKIRSYVLCTKFETYYKLAVFFVQSLLRHQGSSPATV